MTALFLDNIPTGCPNGIDQRGNEQSARTRAGAGSGGVAHCTWAWHRRPGQAHPVGTMPGWTVQYCEYSPNYACNVDFLFETTCSPQFTRYTEVAFCSRLIGTDICVSTAITRNNTTIYLLMNVLSMIQSVLRCCQLICVGLCLPCKRTFTCEARWPNDCELDAGGWSVQALPTRDVAKQNRQESVHQIKHRHIQRK